jgi:hypothetical protein
MDHDPSTTPETPAGSPPTETSEEQVAVLAPPPKQQKWALPLLLLLAAAGIAGYFAWGALRQPPPVKSVMVCITPACGFTEARLLQVGETFPARCPKCSKQSVYAGCRCPKCREATVWNENRGMAGPTKCPKCGTVIPHEDR